MEQHSPFLVPAVYGLACGLPVLALAVVMAFAAHWVAGLYQKVAVFERWARWITGGIFVLAGVYFTLLFIYQVNTPW